MMYLYKFDTGRYLSIDINSCIKLERMFHLGHACLVYSEKNILRQIWMQGKMGQDVHAIYRITLPQTFLVVDLRSYFSLTNYFNENCKYSKK